MNLSFHQLSWSGNANSLENLQHHQSFLPGLSPSIPILSTRPSFSISRSSASSQTDILSQVLCTGMCKQSQENAAGGTFTLPSRESTNPKMGYLKLSSLPAPIQQDPVSPETREYQWGKQLMLKHQENIHKDAASKSGSRYWEGHRDAQLSRSRGTGVTPTTLTLHGSRGWEIQSHTLASPDAGMSSSWLADECALAVSLITKKNLSPMSSYKRTGPTHGPITTPPNTLTQTPPGPGLDWISRTLMEAWLTFSPHGEISLWVFTI